MCILICFPGARRWSKRVLGWWGGDDAECWCCPRECISCVHISWHMFQWAKGWEPVLYTGLTPTWLQFVVCIPNQAYYVTSDRRRWHGTAGFRLRLSGMEIKLCQHSMWRGAGFLIPLFPHGGIIMFLLRGITVRIKCDNRVKVLSTVPVAWSVLVNDNRSY